MLDYPIVSIVPKSNPELRHLSDLKPGIEFLYAQGSERALGLLPSLPCRGLGVVGTRNPQVRTAREIHRVLSALSGADVIIVSGFARGVDAEAHRAALQARLPTVAILGAGLDIPYPLENEQLRLEILKNDGLIISEYPPGAPPLAHQFLKRNRLIAFWSKAVWIAEAGYRSGALNTAKWAREFNRLQFVTPCFPGDPALAGNQKLLEEQNAFPLWNASDLGTAWIELAARKSQTNSTDLLFTDSTPDAREIANQTRRFVSQSGATSVEALLDWAITKEWTPQRFFDALENALKLRLVKDQSGQLSA